MTTPRLVAESNRIEGIHRAPLKQEIDAFNTFLEVDTVTVRDLEDFVWATEPYANLRDRPGMDVRVGNHRPMPGGPEVREQLRQLLVDIQDESNPMGVYRAHCTYEHLHPFMDCNGCSGRVLWHWMMRDVPQAREYGFLHWFYYQALDNWRG